MASRGHQTNSTFTDGLSNSWRNTLEEEQSPLCKWKAPQLLSCMTNEGADVHSSRECLSEQIVPPRSEKLNQHAVLLVNDCQSMPEEY